METHVLFGEIGRYLQPHVPQWERDVDECLEEQVAVNDIEGFIQFLIMSALRRSPLEREATSQTMLALCNEIRRLVNDVILGQPSPGVALAFHSWNKERPPS